MRRLFVRALFVVAGVLVVLGGAALAASLYDDAHRDELLPGITVGEVDAGGRPVAAVLRALDDGLPPVAATTLRVVAGPEEARVTLAELGVRSDAADVVARVRADAERMGLARRVWHRLLDKPVERTYPVQLEVDRARVSDVVTKLAKDVDLAPVDARIDTSSGMVSILPAKDGRALDRGATTLRLQRLADQLANGDAQDTDLDAPVKVVKPNVVGFADVLLVRVAENKLYHYENGVLSKTYTVATGTSRFPTPKGNFSIVLKRRNPTWVNPDPTGWGAKLPAKIGPGPRNPLGTRAMNLNAPGIRIHGTANVASLGTNASHGCIRMAMPDVEELFERVDQGTPVAIIQGPPPPKPDPAAAIPTTSVTPGAPTAPVTGFDPNAPVDLEAG